MSDSVRPHRRQHSRIPCPSLPPRICTNSCPLSKWCHPTISSSVVPFSSYPSIFPSIRVFSNELALHIRWPKQWSFSFSFSPSKEYQDWFPLGLTGLISLQGFMWDCGIPAVGHGKDGLYLQTFPWPCHQSFLYIKWHSAIPMGASGPVLHLSCLQA